MFWETSLNKAGWSGGPWPVRKLRDFPSAPEDLSLSSATFSHGCSISDGQICNKLCNQDLWDAQFHEKVLPEYYLYYLAQAA